jgi:hypothetical protein
MNKELSYLKVVFQCLNLFLAKSAGAGLGSNANLELLRNLFGGLGAGSFGAPANQSNGECFLILILIICTGSRGRF